MVGANLTGPLPKPLKDFELIIHALQRYRKECTFFVNKDGTAVINRSLGNDFFYGQGEDMKKLTSSQIRRMFLDYFKQQGHMVEKGHSLIPHDDPTLLWINSGVAALKKYFDGTIKPASNRITNAQKSIRSNDIENVGKTARHHTFFEMLGNFSIGDYFKREAIGFAWEFLTSEKWMGLEKDKLYITVFTDDKEAYDYWVNDHGVDPSHIARMDHNFWQIGEGPCGPNTEIFYDRGEKYDPLKKGVSLFFNDEENDRYVEVWNVVFSQFNAVEGVDRKDFKELPQKNIDTGMGLERLVCILQEAETNFDTDLFLPIIEKTESFSSVSYRNNPVAYRVIADHIRTITFAIGDGAGFSNEGRGYVLRRIIRRAIRYGKQLKIEGPFMYQLVSVVAKIMEDYYPDLVGKVDLISRLVKKEEERFALTLAEGERLLTNLLDKASRMLSGSDVFKLYDTYGFPFELTLEIAQEKGVGVDKEGFEEAMAKQKEQSRNARQDIESFASQHADLMDFDQPFTFNGYDHLEGKAVVTGLFKDGQRVDVLRDSGEVILDHSVFYAESGGQIYDTGSLSNDQCQMDVLKVFKAPHKQFLHHVQIHQGEVRVGDQLDMQIDRMRRQKTVRNHSSVHLLDSALRQVLGDHVHQAGSFVGPTYARFDFNHFDKLTDEQLQEIEDLVNQWIFAAYPSTVEYLPIDEARAQGAIAMFDEKYDSIVRVVTLGPYSKELCGGTHVSNTQEIGLFKILSEESVGSGIRRITSVTSKEAFDLLNNSYSREKALVKLLSVNQVDLIEQQVLGLMDKIKTYKGKLEQIDQEDSLRLVDDLLGKLDHIQGQDVLFCHLKDTGKKGKDLIDAIKSKKPDLFAFILLEEEGKVNLFSLVPQTLIDKGLFAGNLVKEAAQLLGGNGGGRKDFASAGGKELSKIPKALELVRQKLLSSLSK